MPAAPTPAPESYGAATFDRPKQPPGTARVARRGAAFVVAALVLMMLALSVTSGARAATPTVTGAETDLGVQVPGPLSGLRSEGSAQGVAPDGRYLTYFVNNGTGGQPARFFAMDLTGRRVAEINVPQGTSIISVAYSATSKTVFFAANSATDAFLYEWTGTQLVKRASISGHAVLRLAAAPDGGVYMGSFAPSNGRLFRYVSGTLTDLGQPAAGESYVRSLAVDTSAVWVSNYRESAAKLIRVDRATKAATVVTTPSTFASQWSGFDMTRAGNFLFLRTVNDPRLFAYDTVNKRFATFNDQVARVRTSPEVANPQPYISGISPYGISPLIGGKFVYFQRSGAGVMRVDLTNGLKAIRVDKWDGADNTTPWPSATVPGPVSYAWLSGVAGRSGYSLVATTIDAKVYVNGPGQSAPTILTLPARGAPSTIIRLGLTADGKVLSGGFNLPTGVGVHDPSSHTQSLLTGPQIEGFGRFDSSTVLGGYTGNSSTAAPIYLYSGSGQPQLKVYLNNSQERPVALVQVGRRVAIGSVPIKNTLGGALSLWDPATNALTVKRNLIPNHSIISLAARGNLLIGGSSNVGGTGSTPTATSGQLFTYDTTTGALKTFTPPRAVSATYSWVAAITADPAAPDHYWAISTGYLIQFKVAADGTITLTRNLGAFPNTSSPTGKELGISFVGDTIFATVGGGLSAINRVTGEQAVIAAKTNEGVVSSLIRGVGNRLFYARGTRLYTYQVDSATTTTPPKAPQSGVGLDGDNRADVVARRPDGSLWLYSGTGAGTVRAGRQIGSGWHGYTTVLSPGDFTGDGRRDIIATKSTGALYLHTGNGLGGLSAAKIIGSGWQGFNLITSPGDFTGDGKTDLIARTTAGKLYLYAGNGTGGFAAPGKVIGSGWQMFNTITSPGDFTGDGKTDLIARTPAGKLYLYAGNGTGGFAAPAKVIGNGWQMFNTVIGAGDLTSDGRSDLLARTPAGKLYLYRGNGTGGFAAPGQVVGTGWQVFNSVLAVR